MSRRFLIVESKERVLKKAKNRHMIINSIVAIVYYSLSKKSTMLFLSLKIFFRQEMNTAEATKQIIVKMIDSA